MRGLRNASISLIHPAVFGLAIAVALLCAPASAGNQGTSSSTALGKTRSLAESQHEIVMLLLQQGQYEKAHDEANKIFEMNWPSDQEPLLLKELRNLADQFLHQGQAAIGVRLLEENLKSFKSNASRAAIWKEKGYLYKTMKENDKALACFREAQRLEK